MLKYVGYDIVMEEIPDHISLAIDISNCPYSCKGCHSPFLQEDIGKELTIEDLYRIIQENYGISCVIFMGGDSDYTQINLLSSFIKTTFPTMKIAMYSGNSQIDEALSLQNLDYIKIGPYIEDKGGLDSKTTNQKLYRINNQELELITFKKDIFN